MFTQFEQLCNHVFAEPKHLCTKYFKLYGLVDSNSSLFILQWEPKHLCTKYFKLYGLVDSNSSLFILQWEPKHLCTKYFKLYGLVDSNSSLFILQWEHRIICHRREFMKMVTISSQTFGPLVVSSMRYRSHLKWNCSIDWSQVIVINFNSWRRHMELTLKLKSVSYVGGDRIFSPEKPKNQAWEHSEKHGILSECAKCHLGK